MIQKVWDTDKIADRIQLQAIRQRRPLSCTLELTYQCNFHCRMCYIRMNDTEASAFGRLRTVDEWLDMARQLLDAGVLYLNLTGGECTLYPGFVRLYEKLAQMGFRISIMSNAGAFKDSVRDVFRIFPPYGVAVTLYGGSSETYGAVTGDPSGFDRVLENIRFLRSIGVPVSLNFTMVRQNVLDYPKVAKICHELGIPYTLITDITGHQHGASRSEAISSRLSPAQRACVACHPPEEVALALQNAVELEKELRHFRMPGSTGESSGNAVAPDLTDKAENAEPVPDECIGSHTGCAIYWNGDMQTCISMNGHHNVKPFETGFEAAWQQLKADHESTFLRPEACRSCSMQSDCLHNCAARRFEGTGSPHEPDPYTCQYTYLLRIYRSRQNGIVLPQAPSCS